MGLASGIGGTKADLIGNAGKTAGTNAGATFGEESDSDGDEAIGRSRRTSTAAGNIRDS